MTARRRSGGEAGGRTREDDGGKKSLSDENDGKMSQHLFTPD
jgi:hypothetical protein